MHIGIIGISYKSAPLELREEIARVANDSFFYENCVVLSTCNRTEIYFTSKNLAETHSEILQFLKKHLAISFEHAMYAFFGAECFIHLTRVTAGIESVLIGESDIQRQVKTAYLKTCERISLSSQLHFLFQKSLKIAKEIRSCFFSPMNLEGIIFRLVQKFFESEPVEKIFFIGYSETNRKIASLFLKNSPVKATFCTAHLREAEGFALDHGVSLVDRTFLSSWHEFDLVVGATNYGENGYLISVCPPAFKTKLILDLSVPRSIHPQLNRNPFLTLLNMEEIGNLVKKERALRFGEIASVQKKIAMAAKTQVEIFHQKTDLYTVRKHAMRGESKCLSSVI